MAFDKEETSGIQVAEGALKLVKCDAAGFGDWYLIERAVHDGKEWWKEDEHGASFMRSARISDADVEGTLAEMKGIAKAIRARGDVSYRRCSVSVVGDRVRFSSPRNSEVLGEVPLAVADALADDIEKTS